jgi:mono/diheme cytochrome c family protein
MSAWQFRNLKDRSSPVQPAPYGRLGPLPTTAKSNGLPRNPILLLLRTLAFLMLVFVVPQKLPPANASEPALVIASDAGERRFQLAELLKRPDCVSMRVNGDIYHNAVEYRAVPLLKLLDDKFSGRVDTVEAHASDGFVSQIPLALITRGASGGSVAWIAVEDPVRPWPPLPHKGESAGPFYLIWEHPERSGVSREQWPYNLVRLSFAESPVHRWPQLGLPAELGPNLAARRGQDVFITQCLPCHQLDGGGASAMGPDLNRPMNPTQYLTEAGLRGLIRAPRSVRTWPNQQMAGFDKSTLPDADLNAVVAYLRLMSQKSRLAPAP